MTSKVEIANGALGRLGQSKRLESLTQDHPSARTMNAIFERVVKAEIRKYGWNFAIKRASIAADGTDVTILNTWNRYALPNDFIRLLRDDESGQRVDWKIEGLFILSATTAPLEFRYLAYIEDPNYYDSLFVEALECKLALVGCKEITGSTDLKESIKDDYEDVIAEAKKINAFEKDAQDLPEDAWVAARR